MLMRGSADTVDTRCTLRRQSQMCIRGRIDADWNGVPKTDQPEESLNDPHAAGNVTRSREADVAGMLALFAILPVFLCTVLNERVADRGAGGIKCKNLINGDEDLVVGQEAKVVDAECTSLTPTIQMRVV